MRRVAMLLCTFALWAVQVSAQSPPAPARDNQTALRPIEQAQRTADADAAQARREAAMKEAEILAARGELQTKLKELQREKDGQEALIRSLNGQYLANDKEIERLQKRLEEQEGAINEVSGTVRGIAQDTATLLRRSLVSGEVQGRDAVVEPLLSETEFPTLDNLKRMAEAIFDEIGRNGSVSRFEGPFVDAAGRETNGTIVRVGMFNALFEKDGRIGYLEYSQAKQAFYELTVTPPSEMTSAAKKFVRDAAPGLYLDLSGGSAYRQLTDMPTWYEQLRSGGALMYPLLAVGLLALILMAERLFVLLREGGDCEKLAGQLTGTIQARRWDDAVRICRERRTCLSAVIVAGISHRHERSEVLESVMQESIQSVLPRLERNMSALQILGMVSPLLGLLGTVTGMIATFQMITLYGTGDPKIMSGGISEALITTQYGLIVAIPIILVHGYFQGRIDRIVGLLEEKAITVVNAVKKTGAAEQA